MSEWHLNVTSAVIYSILSDGAVRIQPEMCQKYGVSDFYCRYQLCRPYLCAIIFILDSTLYKDSRLYRVKTLCFCTVGESRRIVVKNQVCRAYCVWNNTGGIVHFLGRLIFRVSVERTHRHLWRGNFTNVCHSWRSHSCSFPWLL